MTGPSGGDEIDRDPDLAESLHRVLATLINVRDGGNALPAEQLRQRMDLVRWLRGELAAVEAFLVAEHLRVQGSAAAAPDGKPAVSEPLAR